MVPVDPANPERVDPEVARIDRATERLARFGIAGLTPEDRGARIALVRPESPAFDQGFRAGQVITQIGDTQVTDPLDIYDAIASLRREAAPVVVIAEDGEIRHLEIAAPQ